MPLLLSTGQIFADDFRVVEPLSEGGMGSLWVVEQLRTGKRRALKVMHAGAGGPAGRRRFEQEARIGSLISSEHVVDVIAAGVDAETDTPWLVMELLEGEDLGEYLARRGALSVAEAKDILGQLCHALGAAHDIPVVHRDLKPENVFLSKSRLAQSPFLVKVLDFGIAKVLTDNPSATGSIGTPMWMAPEQADMGGRVTPAADVWSLGLLAFRLFSGKYYWLAASVTEVQTSALLREILVDPLVPASDRARALGGQNLPAGFDAWFARCVVRDRGARFADARSAWEALSSVLGGKAVADLEAAAPSPLAPSSAPELVSAFSETQQVAPRQTTQDGSAIAVAKSGAMAKRTGRAAFVALALGLATLAALVFVLAPLRSPPSMQATSATSAAPGDSSAAATQAAADDTAAPDAAAATPGVEAVTTTTATDKGVTPRPTGAPKKSRTRPTSGPAPTGAPPRPSPPTVPDHL